MDVLAIIPARYGSTRLPGKPLIKLRGKTLIQRVYERVSLCKEVDEIIVATDDIGIYNHVKKFGGQSIMTRVDHMSGTARCAEVITRMPGFKYVINIQGDEPLIHVDQINMLIRFIRSSAGIQIATLVKSIDNVEDLTNPSKVKVVSDINQRALYFSRAAIPFNRDEALNNWLNCGNYFKHIGMYAYQTKVLEELGRLPNHPLESIEKLEQLNWLAHGFSIHTSETTLESIGVDTEEDAKLVEHLLGLADV